MMDGRLKISSLKSPPGIPVLESQPGKFCNEDIKFSQLFQSFSKNKHCERFSGH